MCYNNQWSEVLLCLTVQWTFGKPYHVLLSTQEKHCTENYFPQEMLCLQKTYCMFVWLDEVIALLEIDGDLNFEHKGNLKANL